MRIPSTLSEGPIIILLLWEFLTPAFADIFSLESEW